MTVAETTAAPAADKAKSGSKILRAGKVVIVLNGRFAGRKAVVVKTFDDGTTARPYPHALLAGIAK